MTPSLTNAGKPNDVSQEAWDAALEAMPPVVRKGISESPVTMTLRLGIALAIMAAEKRGEEREREACAAIIKTNMLCEDAAGSEVLLPRSNSGNKVGLAYAAAILKRGEG